MTTFAKRITAARKEKKLTQEQVAQAMGVSRQTVSHWENGRVEPTQEQREALCRLLEIPADAPQPTPLHRRILAAVALAAFVTILVMAVYPIYKSRHAGANPEAAQETPVPQSEKYSWDWFQQPDAQPVEGQAHIELTTAERPLMLTESENEEKPYVWSILLFAQETNGVSFTMEKVTEVYFNNEKLPMQTAEMTANEIEWYWYSTRLEAWRHDQLCHRPPGGRRYRLRRGRRGKGRQRKRADVQAVYSVFQRNQAGADAGRFHQRGRAAGKSGVYPPDAGAEPRGDYAGCVL